MRICHIWQNFFPVESGGVEHFILDLSNFLTEDSSMQFLMLTDKSNLSTPKKFLLPKKQRIGSIQVYRLGPSFSSFRRNASFKINKVYKKSFDDSYIASLYKEAASINELGKVDVFHLHGFWQPLFPNIGLLLSKHFHRPLIISLHGDSSDPEEPYSMSLQSPSTLNLLKNANVITTFSTEVEAVLNKLGLGSKTNFVPNFVDINKFKRPLNTHTENKVVMVSRIDESKDPLTVIQAFAYVRKELPETTLQIVGYGSLYQRANALVKDLKLETAVSFTGFQQDVREYLWNNDIFIATKSSYVAVLEAWAAGLAVIAPKYGILKQIINHRENGLLVEPGNPKELAQALSELLSNKALHQTLIANGKRSVEQHDVRKVGRRIERIYRSVTI